MGRRVRIVAFVTLFLLQAMTIAALWMVSGQASEAAVKGHFEAQLMAASAEAAVHTADFISPAEDTINVIAALATELITETPELESAFIAQLNRNAQLAGLYVASADGDFLFVSRDGDGYRTKRITIDRELRTVQLTWRDRHGGFVGAGFDTDDQYDPTVRPWYVDAAAADGSIRWTDPYVFFTSQRLGTTASMPMVVDGALMGVVGADIELEALSAFLTRLRVGDGGGALITTASGKIIAHPEPEATRVVGPDGVPRPAMLRDLSDETSRRAAESVVAAGADRAATVEFDGASGAARAVASHVDVGDGKWSVIVHAADDDFVADIRAGQARDRQLLAGIGVLALLLGAGAVFPATRPIQRLAHQANTDPLTQLENRRSIMRRAELAAVRPGDRCFAILDLDHFKEVNDVHGHLVGDEVLEAVAGRLRQSIRPTDALGRIGGEEFLIILEDAAWSEAQPIIERARDGIRATPIVTSVGRIPITASIGVVSLAARSDRSTVLSVADRALLEAKRNGRDRVRLVRLEEYAMGAEFVVDLTDNTAVTRAVVPEYPSSV